VCERESVCVGVSVCACVCMCVCVRARTRVCAWLQMTRCAAKMAPCFSAKISQKSAHCSI